MSGERFAYCVFALDLTVYNSRFRMVPTFGYDTIRCFRANVAELKQLAAHDYEDILQCSIPCLEGLFDNAHHDELIQKLLYLMAYWHSLAKLQIHTCWQAEHNDNVALNIPQTSLAWTEILTFYLELLMCG